MGKSSGLIAGGGAVGTSVIDGHSIGADVLGGLLSAAGVLAGEALGGPIGGFIGGGVGGFLGSIAADIYDGGGINLANDVRAAAFSAIGGALFQPLGAGFGLLGQRVVSGAIKGGLDGAGADIGGDIGGAIGGGLGDFRSTGAASVRRSIRRRAPSARGILPSLFQKTCCMPFIPPPCDGA